MAEAADAENLNLDNMTLQQLEQAFNSFRNTVTGQIQGLYIKLSDIEKSCCSCKSRLNINEHNAYLFDPDGNMNDLFLVINDLFPLDRICTDEKAILVLNDATVYLRFAEPFDPNNTNSGWQIFTYTIAGKQKIKQ